MKTLLFITVILLLYSCRTVQKASEDRYAITNKHIVTTGISSEVQHQEAAQVKYSNMSAMSSSGNGFERWIEEQVTEYSIPVKDSTTARNTATSKVVQTRRIIKERGKQKAISVQQSSVQDSLRKQQAAHAKQEFHSEDQNNLTLVQKRRLTKRTGIPWYIWAGGGVGITLGFWLKKRYQLHKAGMQHLEIHER